jgi:hypothetical protein
VILDDQRNVLGDSQVRPAGASLDTYGDNVGCPASEAEIAFFTFLLKSTSKLNGSQLDLISKRFAQNKLVPAKPTAPVLPGTVVSK